MNSNHRELIEAETLTKALESAPAGLTLKQLSLQLPSSGPRKPKLRATLRTLVADGRATFDGQRYHLVKKYGARKEAPVAPVAPVADDEPASVALAMPVVPRTAAAAADHPQTQAGSGRARTGAAKTVAAHVPAALAEGIRLRRDQQNKSSAKPDPRGAANWGEAREKKPAPASGPRYGELVGLLHLKSEGYGFVSPLLGASSRDEDVFIPPGSSSGAIDGDIVRVKTSPGRDGRTVGEVVQIVEERRQLAIGAYRSRGSEAIVEPHDRRMSGSIIVARDSKYSEGELVKVRLRRGSQGGPVRGEVIGPLGPRGEARFEILAAAYAQGFSDEFDAAVRKAAEDVPDRVRPEDHAGRRDLREMPLATIDGEDARDFDDAVYVERSGAGYRLVVAIADVASYVPEDGAIDREALRRATSVYFPGTVLPMLPEELSNGICSLNPDVERLCMVCDMQLDARGVPRSAEVYPAVMKSHARLTYTQVAAVLDGEVPEDARIAARIADLLIAGELAKKMTAVRFGRGALDFDLPEPKIILNDDGEVIEISSRPRNDAHRLVEEFMLAANEAVARFFSEQDLSTLYRVHDQPDADKLEAFGSLAAAHGFKLPARLTPSALGDLLKQLEGAPAQRALTQLLLRAMMQAHYAPDDIGHYGLAAPTYLHFTSPIRRYPDLTVHRLLWRQWARDGKKQSAAEHDDEEAQLAGIGAQCSERERAAMRAERDVVSFYAASFMQEHVGEEFDARVTGVSDLGLFCLLDSPAVEGLIPAESLGHGLRLDTELQRITMGSSGKTWALGDTLRIRVMSADPAKRRINFAVIEGEEAGDDEADRDGDEDGEELDDAAPRPIAAKRPHAQTQAGRGPAGGGWSPPARRSAPDEAPQALSKHLDKIAKFDRADVRGKTVDRTHAKHGASKFAEHGRAKQGGDKFGDRRDAKHGGGKFRDRDSVRAGGSKFGDRGPSKRDGARSSEKRGGERPGSRSPERESEPREASKHGAHGPRHGAHDSARHGAHEPAKHGGERFAERGHAPHAAKFAGRGQGHGERAAASPESKKREGEQGWLREEDLAKPNEPRTPRSLPSPGKYPLRNASRGGPPPRRGGRPSPRR